MLTHSTHMAANRTGAVKRRRISLPGQPAISAYDAIAVEIGVGRRRIPEPEPRRDAGGSRRERRFMKKTARIMGDGAIERVPRQSSKGPAQVGEGLSARSEVT